MAPMDGLVDSDGDFLCRGETVELMSGGPTFRVLIIPNTQKEVAIKCLRKVIDWLEREPHLLQAQPLPESKCIGCENTIIVRKDLERSGWWKGMVHSFTLKSMFSYRQLPSAYPVLSVIRLGREPKGSRGRRKRWVDRLDL